MAGVSLLFLLFRRSTENQMVVRRSTLTARPAQAAMRVAVARMTAIVLLMTMWTCTTPYTKAYTTSFDAWCVVCVSACVCVHLVVSGCILAML